jgi:hypothetical protein
VSWQREHAELEPPQAPQATVADPAAPLRELVSHVNERGAPFAAEFERRLRTEGLPKKRVLSGD